MDILQQCGMKKCIMGFEKQSLLKIFKTKTTIYMWTVLNKSNKIQNTPYGLLISPEKLIKYAYKTATDPEVLIF